MVGLLSITILIGLGERPAERFRSVFLYALGSEVLAVGLLSGLNTLLVALYSFPGGED